MKVKTAVLPVAGLGTRIMPLTLHQPKSMVGIVDRPMIHYVIDEMLAGGITHIVIVAGPDQEEFQRYIEHLEKDPEWRKLGVRFDFAIQENPIGNGDAVFAAKKFLGREQFLVAFSDDLLADKTPPMKTLLEIFEKTGAPVIMLDEIPAKEAHRYGVVKTEPSDLAKDLYRISDVVEKPKAEDAPSNLSIIGRYILTHDLMDYVEKLYPYNGKEIGLADALKNYANDGHKLYGWLFQGKRFDAGSKIGILQAQVYFGLQHKDIGPEFKKYLQELR